MKKNKTMRVASLLLVAVLMTACVISGTFAKYVTSGDVADTARVAKFGVTVTATSELFKTEYATDDTSYSGTLSVKSSDTDKVVAPGTKGNISAAGLTGTPEVAVRVSYENVAFDLGDNWIAGGAYYCPLIIKVNDDAFCGLDYDSAADFEADVVDAIEAVTADFAPNTDLSAVDSVDVAVSWEWPFETGATATATGTDYDALDTELGDAAATAASFEDAATVSLAYDVTVTQID